MVVFMIGLIVVSLWAGVGIKWAVDRVWPPPVYVGPARLAEPAGRHARQWDDTMDVLADGFQAGARSERTGRPWASHAGELEAAPRTVHHDHDTLDVPLQFSTDQGTGWANGSMSARPPEGFQPPEGFRPPGREPWLTSIEPSHGGA